MDDDRRIRELQAQGRQRGLLDQAWRIAKMLGIDCHHGAWKYKDERLVIRAYEPPSASGLSIGRRLDDHWTTVFSQKARDITSYLPGEWEAHLSHLDGEARKEASRREQVSGTAEAAERRRRFGLP